MQGCALPLVAEHRKTFRFVLEVLKELARIRDHAIDRLSELELNRLANPFRNRSKFLHIILQLLEQGSKARKNTDDFEFELPGGTGDIDNR